MTSSKHPSHVGLLPDGHRRWAMSHGLSNAKDFRDGLAVEVEHGTRYPEARVTNNYPVQTGKIGIAHLNETLVCYRRLTIMELEIAIQKARVAKDAEKLKKDLKTRAKEKLALKRLEAAQLKRIGC